MLKGFRVRGMRDLTTLQGRYGGSTPYSREVLVAEHVRLTRQRTRLERERILARTARARRQMNED